MTLRKFLMAAGVFAALGVATASQSQEVWVSIGPAGVPLTNGDSISGQVNAIAVHPRNPDVVYIGASEGGVWKTVDGGRSWTPLTDFQLPREILDGSGGFVARATLSIGSLAIDPIDPEIVYAGTGDANVADGIAGRPLGMFRSSNGGGVWIPMGSVFRAGCPTNRTMSERVVNRIVVQSVTPARIFAATDGGLFRYDEDGTDCWQAVTLGLPLSGKATDMVRAGDGALYAAFQSRGIFKSINAAGTQWKALALPAFFKIGRIALASSRSNSKVLYAGLETYEIANDISRTEMQRYALLTTADGGDQWLRLPDPPSNGQLEFNNAIAVDPLQSDTVYIGQVSFYRTSDGGRSGGINDYRTSPPITGRSWTELGCCNVHKNPFRQGLDLHADLHDIVFAPSSSRTFYVATDGGVTKGVISEVGVITWQSITTGLTIGQCGTIGLAPANPDVVACGLWHSGNVITDNAGGRWQALGGGDGFQTSIDAASSERTPITIYFNCNAGELGGAICRARGRLGDLVPLFTQDQDPIWSNGETRAHWSDPSRPGDLLRKICPDTECAARDAGRLYHTGFAAREEARVLDRAASWTLIDPPPFIGPLPGKAGNTTTVAFMRKLLAEPRGYFIGTDTGQIWGRLPQRGWTLLCECGAKVQAIAIDFNNTDRIVAVLAGGTSPGRIKEVTGLSAGVPAAKNIDNAFDVGLLRVDEVTSVVIDPLDSDTVFVGTDLGIWRGQRRGAWEWVRSPGVPNVRVVDLEAHQTLGPSNTGVVRAGTYGRGVYELRRVAFATAAAASVESKAHDRGRVILAVQAIRVDVDGLPPSLSVDVPVTVRDDRVVHEAPFELKVPGRATVTLKAPRQVRQGNLILRFIGWTVGRQAVESRDGRVSLMINESTIAVAHYELLSRIPDARAGDLFVSLTVISEQICLPSLTHKLTVKWTVSGGQRPADIRIEFAHPNGENEIFGLKPLDGSQVFALNFPDGGQTKIKVRATDWTGASTLQEPNVFLGACGPR